MKVTLEQIDELRSRVNVSYDEAKKTLEKNDGDLIKSIIELEKKKGVKKEKSGGDSNFTSFVDKLLAIRMSIKNKNGKTILNLPLVVILLGFLMAFWLVISGLLIAVLTSCKIDIYRDKSTNVDSVKRNVQETMDKIKVKSEELFKEEDEISREVHETNEEEENEIIIE